jgi:hypothetical protein
MNKTLLALIKSIAITTTISTSAGLAAYYAGGSFLFVTVLTFFIQFIGFFLFNTILEYKAARDARLLNLKEVELVAQNTMTVECASCKKENTIIIRTNRENRFICGHCNTKNSVYLFTETAVVTEPMYETSPLPNTTSTNEIDRN